MTRTVGATFRDSIESPHTSESPVMFATITHPNLLVPITVNSDVVDYILNGVTYLGTAFSISMLTDDDAPPTAKIAIPNVDSSIGEVIQNLKTSPRIKIELYAKADFDDNTPHAAIGTPTVEYSAQELFLKNVSCDVLGFTADLFSYDIANEPWPAIRSTMRILPALFARAPIVGW